jgi:sulfatase modifying factor 1
MEALGQVHAWTLAAAFAVGGCVPQRSMRSTAPEPAAPPAPATIVSQSTAPPPAKAASAPPVGHQPTPHCPQEMALVRRLQGAYCIDRWEASIARVGSTGQTTPWPGNRPVDGIENETIAVSQGGRKPQGYISGAQAAIACGRAGKRLCEIDEWVRACKGPRRLLYPYGSARRPNVCNDRFKVLDHHPVVTLFNQHAPPGTDRRSMWHPSWMNDARLHEMAHTIDPSGSHPACTNEYGVYDMVGNLHEWVADPDGTFMGGFFMDTFQNGQGCEYRTIAHPYEYHDYSIGFRCCADALS